MRDDEDAAQACRDDPYGRSLAATLNGLAGDWIDRTALAARLNYESRLASAATNSATSLKQAVFGHLREF
jgi:hypothetical protein